jgi:hypothetical protein
MRSRSGLTTFSRSSPRSPQRLLDRSLFAIIGFIDSPGVLRRAVAALCACVEFVAEFPHLRLGEPITE